MKRPTACPHARSFATALLALCCLSSARADYPSTVLSQGPVGYWRLNETTPVPNPATLGIIATNLGSLGAAENGTYEGDLAGRAALGAIAGNNASAFDGSVEYVDLPGMTSAFNPGDFAAECWFAPAGAGNTTCIMSLGDFTSARRGWLVYQTSQSQIQLRTYNGVNTTAVAFSANTNMTLGTYYHLAVARSNTTFRVYINGTLLSAGIPVAPNAYVGPNSGDIFTIGVRSTPLAFPWAGKIDEVAYYTNNLDQPTVLSHYQATGSSLGYKSLILSGNPALYFRLDEPGLPETANLGSLGVIGNGKMVYPAVSGVAGPSSPTYAGLETTNVCVSVSGSTGSKLAGGYVRLPALNLKTNAVTITCWIKPNGGQAPGAGIVMQRETLTSPTTGTSAGLIVDAGGGQALNYNWDGENYPAPTGINLVDGDWNFAALIVKPDSISIFAPGISLTPFSFAHRQGALTFESTTAIGTDAAGSGYNGSLDEVAIFNRALGLGEVYSEYATAVGNLAPTVFLDPQAPASSPYAGDPLTLTVDAGGTQTNFTYQWRKATVPIGGATNSSYTIPVLAVTDSGSYDVVITNNFGTATSAAAVIVVQPQAGPTITQDVIATNRTLYAGGAIKLSVQAAGGGLTYQWRKGGTNLSSATNVLGVTTSSLQISSLVATNAGTYALFISNAVSTITSAPVIIAIGAPGPNTYEALIVADGPVSWYRLDDAPGSPLMLDAMGNADGVYLGSGATMGTTGVLTNDANKAATFASGGWGEITNLPPQAATGDFTYECWVRTANLTSSELCPLSAFRSKYGFWFQKDTGASWRGRDGYGELDGNDSRQAIIGNVTAGQWTHLVAIVNSLNINQNNGHKIFINGRWTGTGPFLDFCREQNIPMRIGALDPNGDYGLTKFFGGDIDEVAIYGKALTDSQILAHYLTAIYSTNGAPFFKTPPTSQTVFIGATATFATLIEGSPFVGQNWYKNGLPITGNTSATNMTLTLPSVGYADAIGVTYYCVATNFVGPTTSSVVTLTVLPQPSYANLTNNLVLHLRFDGDYADSSGHSHNATAVGSPSIAAGHVGSGALHYSTVTDGTDGHGGTLLAANYLTLGSFTNGSDLSFSNNVSFSVGYWVKVPTNGYRSGDLPFFSSCLNSYQNGATTQKGLDFAPTYFNSPASPGTVGGWSWSLADGATAAGLYGPAGSINGTNADNHTLWHHLLHTFNRATGAGITYLDGQFADNTGFGIVDNIDSGNPFNIGQDPSGAYGETGEYYVDDLCVWKGRIISSTEAYSAYYIGNVYGRSVDGLYPITITVTKIGSGYWIVWQGGTLQQAGAVTGPWTPVGGASSPYYQMPLTGTNRFYKVSP